MLRRIFIQALVLFAATSALASGEDSGSLLITPKFGVIIWTLVTFLLLLYVLGRFAWRPLLGAIEERERSIRENLDHAALERAEAEKLLEEHKALIVQARRERAEALAAGQRDAERLKDEIVDEGRKRREELLTQAESQIQAEMQQARAELRGIAADLSIRVAERLLAKNLDPSTQRKLVEEYLDELDRESGESSTMPS